MGATKFKSKPKVIEAIQFATTADIPDIIKFCPRAKETLTNTFRKQLVIKTLEGDMAADVGVWIIKGVKGEFYPCKPDIFEVSYEKAE